MVLCQEIRVEACPVAAFRQRGRASGAGREGGTAGKEEGGGRDHIEEAEAPIRVRVGGGVLIGVRVVH